MSTQKTPEVRLFREFWNGDSRDGKLVGGDGWHYFAMTPEGEILDAYEFYETDDGTEVISPLPEMKGVHWINDLGFEDFESLEPVDDLEFAEVRELAGKSR